jgi:L-rhamnose mutarotase
MKRYGQLIRIKPEKFEGYRVYHAKVWPEVLETIRRCHVHNYSIFHWQGLLFAYFEYRGKDYASDMAKMAADPKTQEWWKITMPMQEPVPGRAEGDWWAGMEEVFHTD